MEERKFRKEKIENIIRETSAMFFETEGTRDALISVTRVEADDKLQNATIFVSVMPSVKEAGFMDFAKRHMDELRRKVQDSLPSARSPFLSVEIDAGEKLAGLIERL